MSSSVVAVCVLFFVIPKGSARRVVDLTTRNLVRCLLISVSLALAAFQSFFGQKKRMNPAIAKSDGQKADWLDDVLKINIIM